MNVGVHRSHEFTARFIASLARRLRTDVALEQRFHTALRRMLRADASTCKPSLLHYACTDCRKYKNMLADVELAWESDPAIVTLLIELGADVNGVDRYGNTPAHYAASSCVEASEDVVEGGEGVCKGAVTVLGVLVRNKAHMDQCNPKRCSPIGLLGALWPGVLEGQGQDVEASARVSPLSCLAARVVVANNIEYRGVVPIHVADFAALH